MWSVRGEELSNSMNNLYIIIPKCSKSEFVYIHREPIGLIKEAEGGGGGGGYYPGECYSILYSVCVWKIPQFKKLKIYTKIVTADLRIPELFLLPSERLCTFSKLP